VRGVSIGSADWFLGLGTPDVVAASLMAELLELAQDDEALLLLREWTKERQDLTETVILAVKFRRGFKEVASLLRKLVSAPGGSSDSTSTFDGLPPNLADQLQGPLQIPEGWHASLSGIFERVQPSTGGILTYIGGVPYRRVAHRPILPVRREVHIDLGCHWLGVAWPSPEGWRTIDAPRQELLQAKTLSGLAGAGAPVHSENARQIVRFLAAVEAENEVTIPLGQIASRLGWKTAGSSLCFLLADQAVGPGADHLRWGASEYSQEALLRGFRRRGDPADWARAWDLAREHAGASLSVLAALGSVLVSLILTASNWILDFYGPTSMGKTSAARLGASCWGAAHPGTAAPSMWTWDLSTTGLERLGQILGGLPLILDDTQRARSPAELAAFAYLHAGAVGRVRGTPDGLRAIASWRSILISTGEAPLTSFSRDAGTRARVLSVADPPFGPPCEGSAVKVSTIRNLTAASYGHVGPDFVAWLLADPSRVEALNSRYTVIRTRREHEAGTDPVMARAADYLALLELVAEVFEESTGLRAPTKEALMLAERAARESAADADQAGAAFDVVLDLIDRGDCLGVISHEGERVLVRSTWLNDELKERGFSDTYVRRVWITRGWLVPNDAYRRGASRDVASKRRVGGGVVPVYTLRLPVDPCSE
jgi:hypothetical protein